MVRPAVIMPWYADRNVPRRQLTCAADHYCPHKLTANIKVFSGEAARPSKSLLSCRPSPTLDRRSPDVRALTRATMASRGRAHRHGPQDPFPLLRCRRRGNPSPRVPRQRGMPPLPSVRQCLSRHQHAPTPRRSSKRRKVTFQMYQGTRSDPDHCGDPPSKPDAPRLMNAHLDII
jgi:hypothetical protein